MTKEQLKLINNMLVQYMGKHLMDITDEEIEAIQHFGISQMSDEEKKNMWASLKKLIDG